MIDKSQQENQGEGEHDTDGTANNEVCDVPPIQQIMETNNSLSEATYEETRERGDCISVPEDDSFREEVGREMGQEGTQDATSIARDWREAMENKKWKRAMMEEMLALEKK